jgi:hypothetical protein
MRETPETAMPLVYLVLFIIAAMMVIGLVIGVTLKIAGFVLVALLVLAGVGWAAAKLRGGNSAAR